MNSLVRVGAVLVLVLLPTSVVAQAAAGFRAGVRNAGLSTGQSTSTIDEPVYGVYIGFPVSDRLALQIEGVYGVRGAEGVGLGNGTLDPAATAVRLDMRYLDVPILLRAGFPGERLLASFFAGPYLGFLLSCQVTPTGAAGTACDEITAAQRFVPRETDVGVLAGAGLDVAIGTSTIFVDARYALGFLSIQAGDEGFDARHNSVGVTLGLAVPLGR